MLLDGKGEDKVDWTEMVILWIYYIFCEDMQLKNKVALESNYPQHHLLLVYGGV